MSGSQSRKRQRTNKGAIPEFGAPNQDDKPSPQSQFNTSFASSSRVLDPSPSAIPSLATLCARRFATSYVKIADNEKIWKRTSHYLRLAPDSIVPKIFSMLVAAFPTYLKHEIIVLFFRGPSISLDSGRLPGAKELTVAAIPRLNPTLRELKLSGFVKISDEKFASIFPSLVELRTVVLRGCAKVGPKTVAAMAKSCPHLKTINLNETSVPPIALADVLRACTGLEVLKLAGIRNWTDTTFAKLSKSLPSDSRFISVRTLKLRMLPLSDHHMNTMISYFPNVKRLDLSSTPIKHPRILTSSDSPDLEKLMLTSTEVSASDLLTMIPRFPNLKTLALGGLGTSNISKSTISNSSAMSLTDSHLRSLTDILSNFQDLESVNLAANTKLCVTGPSKDTSAVEDFVNRVGRRCKFLNLSAIPGIRSTDLSGLALDDFDLGNLCPLEKLVLNQTGIDDDASPFITACHDLSTLEVSGTRFTSDGLFTILDSCPRLEHLDITSCRGVPVVDRRRFFEVWEARKNEA